MKKFEKNELFPMAGKRLNKITKWNSVIMLNTIKSIKKLPNLALLSALFMII